MFYLNPRMQLNQPDAFRHKGVSSGALLIQAEMITDKEMQNSIFCMEAKSKNTQRRST